MSDAVVEIDNVTKTFDDIVAVDRVSLRVQQGCYSQANGNPQKQKSCRQHYQGNIVRCQGLL